MSDTPRTDELFEQFGPVAHPAAMAYFSLSCELEREKAELRAALLTILDAVDYTAGNCRTNDMVSAALDRVLIVNARKVLK